MKQAATHVEISNRNIRIDMKAVQMEMYVCLSTGRNSRTGVERMVCSGNKGQWSQDSALTCKTGERVVCVTARRPVLW